MDVRAVVIVPAVVVCERGGVVVAGAALKVRGMVSMLVIDGARVDPLKVRERMRMENLSLKLGLREVGWRFVGVLGAVVCWRSHCVTRLERDGDDLANGSKGPLSTGVAGVSYECPPGARGVPTGIGGSDLSCAVFGLEGQCVVDAVVL